MNKMHSVIAVIMFPICPSKRAWLQIYFFDQIHLDRLKEVKSLFLCLEALQKGNARLVLQNASVHTEHGSSLLAWMESNYRMYTRIATKTLRRAEAVLPT